MAVAADGALTALGRDIRSACVLHLDSERLIVDVAEPSYGLLLCCGKGMRISAADNTLCAGAWRLQQQQLWQCPANCPGGRQGQRGRSVAWLVGSSAPDLAFPTRCSARSHAPPGQHRLHRKLSSWPAAAVGSPVHSSHSSQVPRRLVAAASKGAPRV